MRKWVKKELQVKLQLLINRPVNHLSQRSKQTRCSASFYRCFDKKSHLQIHKSFSLKEDIWRMCVIFIVFFFHAKHTDNCRIIKLIWSKFATPTILTKLIWTVFNTIWGDFSPFVFEIKLLDDIVKVSWLNSTFITTNGTCCVVEAQKTEFGLDTPQLGATKGIPPPSITTGQGWRGKVAKEHWGYS